LQKQLDSDSVSARRRRMPQTVVLTDAERIAQLEKEGNVLNIILGTILLEARCGPEFISDMRRALSRVLPDIKGSEITDIFNKARNTSTLAYGD
jgi:hypothetical protein